MNKDRLLLLADALETRIPAEKFALDDWRESTNDDDSNEALLHGCGTTGCAVGWACALPEFIAQGLTWSSAMARPVFEGDSQWEAVCNFFEIDSDAADHLFSPIDYPDFGVGATPSDVAGRIRALVGNSGEVPI